MRDHAQGAAPDLEQRYMTAESVAADLERWLTHRPIEWQRPGPLKRLRLWSKRRPAVAVAASAVVAAAVIGGAARWEWVRREQQRDAEVAARVETKAQKKVDDIGGNVQRAILSLARKLTLEQKNQMNNEELMASLSVMGWINFQGPNREDEERRTLHDYGVTVWNEILTRCQTRAAGEADSLALFAHINLARLALDEGDNTGAAKHADAAEKHWGSILTPNDTSTVALKIVRAVLAKRNPDTPAGVIDVAGLEREALQAGIGESLLRHLRPTPKASSGSKKP
ncbi:MAG: hypothetical protein QM783_13425 [Phycisphaerales bacterium]